MSRMRVRERGLRRRLLILVTNSIGDTQSKQGAPLRYVLIVKKVPPFKGSKVQRQTPASFRCCKRYVTSKPVQNVQSLRSVQVVQVVCRSRETRDLARFDNSQNVKTRLIRRDTSTFREFPKRKDAIYFLRFFSRVRSSFIDIVGSFLLSSINFQKVEEV